MPTDPTTTAITAAPVAPRAAPDTDAFRQFMSRWPTGVTIVTTRDGGAPTGCTVNAMMSVSLAPPLLLVALTAGSSTLRAIREHGVFALNVLTADQRRLCDRFAGGDHRERFRDVPHRWHHDVPLLDEFVAAAVCRVQDTFDCGDHVLVVGAPQWHSTGTRGAPLVFYRRDYLDLAGAAAFSGPAR